MSGAIVRFRSPHQPAHYVRADRGYKFVGGRLTVTGSDAEAVWAYALANPSVGIVEERPQRAQSKPRPQEAES